MTRDHVIPLLMVTVKLPSFAAAMPLSIELSLLCHVDTSHSTSPPPQVARRGSFHRRRWGADNWCDCR